MAKISNENVSGAEPRAKTYAFRYSEGVPVRDPFILRVGGTYYLYEGLHPEGVLCYTSADLEEWYGPVTVFRTPDKFHGVKNFFWAPEVHFYRGKFYLFTSVFSSKTGHRSISVYRAESPLGPFEDIADGCVGMPQWDCIDGTLFVDEKGQPWMVFVHEWVSMPDGNGAMCAAKLSDDLSRFASEPVTLFYADEQPSARTGVTDGPFLYKTEGGKLLMIWSNYGKEDYFIAKAVSDSGELFGPWRQEGLLYERGRDGRGDGGHGMLFYTKEGQLTLAFHSPNDHPNERLVLWPLSEHADTLIRKK